MTNNTELLARHHAVMGHDAPLFYENPIELVRGDGVWLFDSDGRRYLDVYNNVPCVGHANPRVVEAVAHQTGTLNVHSRYLHDGVIDWAERVVGLHHSGLESLVVTCTGSEANEVAMMMARAATGAHGIICTDATYHGNTREVSKLTRLPAGEHRDGVRSIPAPQRYRTPEPGMSDADLCAYYLERLREQIQAFVDDGLGFAGILLCTIFANEGLVEVPDGFLREMADVVHDAGGLIIGDEVQAGYARSGSWWGYETYGIVPDIAVMGKPMGNGVPVAGVVASHELVTGFRRKHRYFNTFAASPLQAAAGMAVIDEITDRNLVTQVDAVGLSLKASMKMLQADYPQMGDVRGTGLFIGIDWVVPGTTEPDVDGAAQVVEAMRERGVLMGKAGQYFNVLKLRPPLVFDHEHAAIVTETFTDAVAAVTAQPA